MAATSVNDSGISPTQGFITTWNKVRFLRRYYVDPDVALAFKQLLEMVDTAAAPQPGYEARYIDQILRKPLTETITLDPSMLEPLEALARIYRPVKQRRNLLE